MSSDYKILIESDEQILLIKTKLEQIIRVPMKLSQNWEYYDLYYVELIGLWIQLSEYGKFGPPLKIDDEFYPYSFKVQVGFLGELINPEYGKPLVRSVIVELARMIAKNMKNNCVVVRDDLITHNFTIDSKKRL